MKRVFLHAAVVFCLAEARGQDVGNFDVILRTNYESAERTLELYQGLSGRPQEVAALPGSQIALATTALLAQRTLTSSTLERALEAVKFNQSLEDDVFRLKEARANVGEIRELLVEAQRRNFGSKVVGTVAQLFPPDARIRTVIPVFFVAFGHQNIDAFVRRVRWNGNTPAFTAEGEGELTIVVNLAKAVNYGKNTDERFVGMVSVVAHEVFHAAFGTYKDGSPAWRAYYAAHRSPLDQLLDLTHNEGIAYYLSLVQSSRGRLPADGLARAQRSFAMFNANAAELLSPRTSDGRAEDIIRQSNTSGYWDNYGAITGMIIARQIDNTLGRQALIETIALGPTDFFAKYAGIAERNAELPQLGPRLLEFLRRGR
ncbi:MAG: DUF5700 domain-containing putative Zn-dependent protease [Bacteroidota bacterium]